MADNGSGIYTIRSPSGRYYVGSAVRFAYRWRTHVCDLKHGRHHCAGLQAAYHKYGLEQLTFEVVERCVPELLIEREQCHMDAAQPRSLYNSLPKAGSMLGMVHSPEARSKLSRAHKGKTHTPEHRANVSAAKREQSPETRAKISAAKRGVKLSPVACETNRRAHLGLKASPATKLKMSQIRKGRKFTPEHRANMAESRRGKKHSETTLAKLRIPCSPEKAFKISETHKRRHAAHRSVMMAENTHENGP